MRTHTSPSIVKLAAVGAVAGLVSGLVKLGWEKFCHHAHRNAMRLIHRKLFYNSMA